MTNFAYLLLCGDSQEIIDKCATNFGVSREIISAWIDRGYFPLTRVQGSDTRIVEMTLIDVEALMQGPDAFEVQS